MTSSAAPGAGGDSDGSAAAAAAAGASNGEAGPNNANGHGPLLRPHHMELVATLRSLVRPLLAAEEAERLALLHRSKIKRLRAVGRHLEAETARRRVLKSDRQCQTEATFLSNNPFTRAFANRAAVPIAPAPPAPTPATTAGTGSGIVPAGYTIDLTRDQQNHHSQQQQRQQQQQQQQFSTQPRAPQPPPGPPLDRVALLPVCLRVPPALEVTADPTDRQSAELHWHLRGLQQDRYKQVVNYSVWYCYQRQGMPADPWAKTADLRALPLPMRCQVGIDSHRGACHFVLRAEDTDGRQGQWSNVVSWPPLQQLHRASTAPTASVGAGGFGGRRTIL